MHCGWFILLLLLPTPTIWFSLDHRRNVSDRVISGVGRNGNVLILLTPIPLHLMTLIFLFSVGHKHSYDSSYNFDFDSALVRNSVRERCLYNNSFWVVRKKERGLFDPDI